MTHEERVSQLRAMALRSRQNTRVYEVAFPEHEKYNPKYVEWFDRGFINGALMHGNPIDWEKVFNELDLGFTEEVEKEVKRLVEKQLWSVL